MENKKGAYQSQTQANSTAPSNEAPENEAIPKHTHQQNTAPQHVRYLQYGLKIPNHQHPQSNQYQQINSPLHLLPHHQNQQLYYRHLRTSPQFNTPNNAFVGQKYVYQNQKLANTQPIYQSTQPPPASVHTHNLTAQNTPQIWVPHQPPPIHYHQLQKAEAQKTSNPTTPQAQGKPKDVVERKKSTGSVQLRSPSAKRPLEAPVTMQGWLHKQGSEGLMLWKKRWFVLSEYCLFYYKGLEEEKLLGSILLPSYKVSICRPEEKVGRKFAFKCEHANMRTYVLAADTQELMMQWVRVLNLACMLQTNVESEKPSDASESTSVHHNKSFESSESNSSAQQYHKTNLRATHSPSNTLNISPQDQSQYNQPLYANAPPKPRRLNDGFSSPSPDVLDRYNPQYFEHRNINKSPVNIYNTSLNVYGTKDSPREYVYTPSGEVHAVERRTPDTYGRSKLNPAKFRHPTDYEDVFAEQSMYKRPLSPIAYTHAVKKTNPPPPVSPAYRAYTPVNMIGPAEVIHYPPPQMRKLPNTNIARPHSADFLEYEINHRQPNSAALTRQQPRPKSSLDINRHNDDNDGYFYSEELYAEKMRKSAQYLQKMPHRFKGDMASPKTAPAPVRYPENENAYPLMRSNTQPINFNKLHISDTPEPQPMRSRSVLSEGSLSKEIDVDFGSQCDSLSPDYAMRDVGNYASNMRNGREYELFTRSASARMAQTTPQMDRSTPEKRMVARESERKREESMKRLLEWKQRMLQSPLNRKLQGNKGYPGRGDYPMNQEDNYKLRMHPKHGEVYLDERQYRNNLPQYNSYSSDDEENEERSKEIVQSQAGRTLDTYSKSPSPAQTTSTTVLSTFVEPAKPLTHPILLHDSQYTNAFERHSENDNAKEHKDDTLTKPLKQFSKEASNVAHVSNLRSEYSDKFEPTPSVTEMKSNGALVKSILAEYEKKSSTEKESEAESHRIMLEENYMPMSPKKSVLSPRNSTNYLSNESENDENHYVEMTQMAVASVLDLTNAGSDQNEQQPYEMVCFNGGKLEPVYMEVNTEDPKLSNNSNKLPDILMTPKKKGSGTNKSDGSDADDEASKDLDSLDTPSRARFSLSDTFRPASYYLGGATQVPPEGQDSSDSELVSPPPIPSSPPLLDELDSTEDYNFAKEQSKKDDIYRFNFLTRSVNRNSDQFFNSNNKYTKKSSKNVKGSTLSLDTNRPSDKDCRNEKHSKHSDSEVELRDTKTVDYETRLKRRPVSEEFRNELESLDGTFVEDCGQDVELEKYLSDLQISSLSLASIDEMRTNSASLQMYFHEYENLIISGHLGNNDTCLTEDTSRPDFSQIIRPESSTSISAELNSILHNSNRSTPVVEIAQDISSPNVFCPPSAPYYYSDLSINIPNNECSSSMLTLNNQRESTNGSKRDITHIINPIKRDDRTSNKLRGEIDEDNSFKLAAEARSVSVDFLNLTDKSDNIDKKNIYESDTLKRQKTSDYVDPKARNFYQLRKSNKFASCDVISDEQAGFRRSHSLEGLLENVISDSNDTNMSLIENASIIATENQTNVPASEGSYLWEEDSIWRERLRSASQRHTKSMEDLDTIGEPKKKRKKSPRGITRGVTYVNDNFIKLDKQQKELENQQTAKSTENDIKKEGSFIIDREKLRQWDLLSSAPSDDQLSTITATQAPEGNSIVVEIGEGNCDPTDIIDTQDTASGSISINTRDISQLNTRDTFPRAISAKKIWTPNSQVESRSVTNLSRNNDKEQYGMQNTQQHYYTNPNSNHPEIASENRKENWSINDKMNVSAGELLGRTHEELVLLLIQLRRQNSQTLQAIENCYNEIDSIQAQLHMMDQAKRMENLQKLEQIKQHLIELEKQYEKGKPLVNLVDNMVKLGSLYRVPNDRANIFPCIRERLEFNQQIQERRLLAEEKRDWNRLNPSHFHLQEKVQQLYQLDRLIHEESGKLQNLQQDKEDIERALGGLRQRLSKGLKNPAEVELARKQQIMLENELSRVHLMLAQNSKRLEETVAGNARLEQELLVLKQKLQTSRQQRSSQQYSNAGDSLTCAMGNSAMLESDLQRVQKKIGDLQKQRQELSIQVRQLTDRSGKMSQQKSSPSNGMSNSQCNRKKVPSLWRETDLDTMSIVDHGVSWDSSSCTNTSPLYINTELKLGDSDFYNRSMRSNDSTSDNTSVSSNLPQEKQEIKTVRIVKRESERRQRDREKLTPGKWDAVLEDDSSQSSSVLFRPAPVQKVQSATSLVSPAYEEDETRLAANSHSSISSPNLHQFVEREGTSSTDVSTDKSPELSPVFQSEAARQIITEMSINDQPKKNNRRAIPKEKRRHYTAPHNHIIMKSLHQLPTENDAFNKVIDDSRRARDDLDMERALRQRIDAPDVVRSTLSNKELKYNESTIDNLLGTPNKINIPERYIPEQLPQLSAEEQEYRMRKVESIKKMLSDTAILSTSSTNLNADDKEAEKSSDSITNKATSKMIEEKRQREHLLQLNQILAKQVMEMSKIVAVKALAKLPLQVHQMSTEEEDSSPLTPLPIYQQRDNFYS